MEDDQPAPAADAVNLFGFSPRWWSGPEWKRTNEPAEEPEPSHLNTFNSSGMFHNVSPDKLSVRYVGCGQHGYDVGAVQANCPAPTRRIVYYFEIKVKNAGQHGRIGIGFTPKEYDLRKQPGWDPNSCGYHGDDGYLYHGSGKRYRFGPTFTSGDTVGAGINYAFPQFFFTKNGELVGNVVKDIKGPLFPTIALHSQNEEVTVNFGKQPFLFDIKALELEERQKVRVLIEKEYLTPTVSVQIIRSYLLHYGYQDTLDSFDVESESMHPQVTRENGIEEEGCAYALRHRKILRQLVKNGDIDSVFQKIKEWYPQILQNDTSVISFLLHAQRFIEYLRNQELLEAVGYARAELSRFFPIKSYADLLEETMSLLAYDDPQKSCVGYLLEDSHREYVADAVNAIVLSTNPNMSDPRNYLYSCLEKLLRQLIACFSQRRALNNNEGQELRLPVELEINHGSG
uniref:Ran-binding protein M homolog isoform X1 n=1 Tax=Elaeis guineensis var. tenera TaxID=51953 RepID=A0A6I9QMN1_ELAGV|nr:ran-binding protein M homolog isoform X1 [Elaeis guineensis]XP_010911816.1 ran-binding protein M homolog isoform X1 [Elaeis guineensis]